MRREGTLVVGLLMLAGLAGPVASAQSAQEVDAHIRGHVIGVPDELPGVYQAAIEVEVRASGGHCACQQTTVELFARDAPPVADATVLSPKAFTVDWVGDWEDAYHGTEYREARLSVGVAEAPEAGSMLSVTVDARVDSNAHHVADEAHPVQLALPLPGAQGDPAGDASGDDGNATANGTATGSDAPEPAEAVTASAGPAEAGGLDGTALGTGAGMASLALVGLAVRRARL